jgi:hypothetical protein
MTTHDDKLMEKDISRRKFLERSGLAAIGVSAAASMTAQSSAQATSSGKAKQDDTDLEPIIRVVVSTDNFSPCSPKDGNVCCDTTHVSLGGYCACTPEAGSPLDMRLRAAHAVAMGKSAEGIKLEGEGPIIRVAVCTDNTCDCQPTGVEGCKCGSKHVSLGGYCACTPVPGSLLDKRLRAAYKAAHGLK